MLPAVRPTNKPLLHPNPPFTFNGDRSKGQLFLHTIQTYVDLLPKAFMEGNQYSKVKVVCYAMSYMSADAASRWAEWQSVKTPFPFSTWGSFVKEFCLQFVKENKQDHTLLKLEDCTYHIGPQDIYWYTDDFEDLYDIAGFTDDLVKVTKYRAGLDPTINAAITTSSDAPALRNYLSWRVRAYQQYEANMRARVATRGLRPAPTPPRPRTSASFMSPPATPPTRSPPSSAPITPPVPMDVDRARAKPLPRSCYRCGDSGHLACNCSRPTDIRSTDLLDEVIRQLDGELLEELAARLVTTQSLPPSEASSESSEGFHLSDE